MASTSRSLFLLSLLVSSFCMTATASRSLQETNKLSLVDGLVDGLDLDEILHGTLHDLLDVVFTCDLSELLHTDVVEVLVENAKDILVKLKVEKGLVTELKEPIEVKVSAAGTVIVVVKALGKEVRVPLKLSALDPVLKIVGGVLHLVLKLVEGLNVVHIVNPLTGEILGTISRL